MAGRERPDALPPGEWFWHVAPKIEAGQPRRISPEIGWGYGSERTSLGGEPELAVAIGEIQRLDPERITGKPELALLGYPKERMRTYLAA